jgi:uracil-DNA glycosylase family 4
MQGKKTVSEIPGCANCPMRRLFPDNTFVEPTIGSGLEIAIGDAPSKDDALNGEPMTGGYGRSFSVMLRKAGIERDNVTFANVIQCRPKNDVFPTEKRAQSYINQNDGYTAVTQCLSEHVVPLLLSRPWQKAFVLGDHATEFITGKWASADKWRGSILPVPVIDLVKPLAVVTFSPQQVAAQQKYFPVVVNDLRKSLRSVPENYILYPSLSDVQAFTASEFAFDIETSYEAGANGVRDIYMCALSDRNGRAIVVPFQGAYINELRRIFAGAEAVIGHNMIQFDLVQLAHYGITVPSTCQLWDTMLLQHLRFPDLPHDLEFVVSQYVSKPAWKHEKAVKQLYAARDVDGNFQMFGPLLQDVAQAGLLDLYNTVQVPLAKICRLMTATGMKVDPTRIAEVQKRIDEEIAELELALPERLRSYYESKRKRIPAPEGYRDPVTNKPRKFLSEEIQVKVSPYRKDRLKKQLLYKEWGLPEQLSPKTLKVSVDKVALAKLSRRLLSPSSEFYNPERATQLAALRKINEKEHFRSSFIKEERKQTERIHPELNVHGTNSGRLSSSGGEAGNFQNQPPAARYMYVPTDTDWEFAEVDFSNIENRLMAFLANDQYRLRLYDDPKHNDYKLLASRAFNIPYELVEKDNDRSAPYGKAKAIVLGTNYGLGALKTANLYDMDLGEVKDLMVAWKKEIKRTVAYQDEISKLAKRQGFLVTPFGRKRWFYTDDYHTKALSFLPQSTAADIIYRAMIGLYYDRIGMSEAEVSRLVKVFEPLPQPARMLLQVHDALLFEYPKAMRDRVLGTVKRVMEQPWPELQGFHIPAAVAIGPSWGEVK